MSRIYDNWERLVGATLKREEFRELARAPSLSSVSSDCSSRFGGQHCLSWTTRIKVAVGAARGLSFLHDAEKLVIRRVFQSSNILLDQGSYFEMQDFNVKLSGFTSARFQPPDNGTYVSNRDIRTFGYAAPEYMVKGHLTKKCDVYSFGVVLLEVLSGRPSVHFRDNGKTRMLRYWVLPYLLKQPYSLNNRSLYKIMDTKLDGQYPQKEALTVATLALQCLSNGPKDRPSMAEVVATLEQL